jgi:hypothetical protein
MLYTLSNHMNRIKNTSFRGVFIPILVLLFSAMYSTDIAFAQQSIDNMSTAHIEFTPNYPTPGQTVKAKFVATSIDLDTAFITWSIDGKVIEKSFSAKEISFTAGGVGSVINVSVSAEDGEGSKASVSSQIRVSDVTVVWEGRTYTPPFYKGRALPSPESEITLVTIPKVADSSGRFYSIDELSYVWTTNHRSVPELSGKGKHSVILRNSEPFQDLFVNVQVKDPSGEIRVVKNIVIPEANPMLVLYEDDSYVGMRYDRSVERELSIYNREATLVAEPYYMSVTTRTDPILEYAWSIDGTENTTPGSLSFSPGEGAGEGTTYLSLIIKSTKHWLQNGRSDVTINYGAQSQWGGAVSFETTP